MFEWDEAKRRRNVEIRSLDFIDAIRIFDGRPSVMAASKHPFEQRFLSTAILDNGKFHTVVWTWRVGVTRIISFRRARRDEERAYRQIYR
jgi:uncharacterized DUF497 family protein